jgi:hypothetical protein
MAAVRDLVCAQYSALFLMDAARSELWACLPDAVSATGAPGSLRCALPRPAGVPTHGELRHCNRWPTAARKMGRAWQGMAGISIAWQLITAQSVSDLCPAPKDDLLLPLHFTAP